MSEPPHRRVVMVDAVPMSALVAEAPDAKAVLVAIHGGATSSVYFDCPGHPRLSLLRNAATRGYTTIAIDRPGYGASALYQQEMTRPERRVELAFGVVDEILGDGARGAGTFLLAHSAGCELALRMAVTRTDVLGVEVAGTGLRYRPEVEAVIREATARSRPTGLRDLLWQPTRLYPADVLTGALSARGAAYEVDATSDWRRRDFRDVAARVQVPVQVSVASHENIWDTTPDAVTSIMALFASSPRVVLNDVADSGHNLSVGLSAGSYHHTVLTFADECVAGHRSPGAEVQG